MGVSCKLSVATHHARTPPACSPGALCHTTGYNAQQQHTARQHKADQLHTRLINTGGGQRGHRPSAQVTTQHQTTQNLDGALHERSMVKKASAICRHT